MEDTKSIDGESEILEKADEADEVRQRMVELRRKKEEKLREEDRKYQKGSSIDDQTQYLSGNIESVRGKGDVAEVTVQYVEDGDLKSEMFELELPRNTKDYSIKNRYVRLRKAVGVDESESLMGRDVPIKIDSSGYVQLDIPEKPTKISRLRKKIKRGLCSSTIYQKFQESGTKSALIENTRIMSGSLMVVLSAILLFNAYSSIGAKFVADFLFSSVLIGLVLFPIMMVEQNREDGIIFSSLAGTIGGSILAYLNLIGFIQFVWISSDYTMFQNVATILQYGFTGFMLTCAYIHITKGTDYIRESVGRKMSQAKRKIQIWRGVEYVEE